jgi:HD-GYP domain-containing protein (c-di-GMP phosphodiesterase class II)
MVRQTALLKSRRERLGESGAGPGEEAVYDHGSRKSQSMFLQSGDLDSLLEAVSRKKSEKPRSVTGKTGLPDQPPDILTAASEAGFAVSRKKTAAAITPDLQQNAEQLAADDDAQARYRAESVQADALYIETLDLLEEIYRRKYTNREQIIERLVHAAGEVIETAKNSNTMLRKAVRLKKNTVSFAEHSLNVAILAVKIGAARKFNRERLLSLILCAFLDDIGMTLVDSKILAKSGKLSSGELGEIKNHIRYSQEILSSDFKEFPFLVPVAGQIHEREDGSGYPLGLKRDNIHEFAKIIGLCDVYIAMTSRKAHREDFSGYATLQQIISRRGIDFNAQIIKSLIDVISVFPLESLVKLNNGAIGRVIDVSSLHPTRPKLNILISSDGEHLHTPKYLDLEHEPLLYVEMPDVEEGVVL